MPDAEVHPARRSNPGPIARLLCSKTFYRHSLCPFGDGAACLAEGRLLFLDHGSKARLWTRTAMLMLHYS